MGLSLILAEKPSVGRDIARVLKCSKSGNGYFEGNKYIVTWALGHLVTLADPESYDEKYKAWRLEDLPMLPKELKLVVIKKTSKQFSIVKEQLIRKDVDEVIIATDAGREGELVARWIIEKANVKKPIKRLWISSVTDKAILEGFNKLKSGKDYEKLYDSAKARAVADWVVGINATRALTCKFNAQLSCGRVQTPTLNIISKREDEIQKFKPKTYYGITAQAKSLKFTWQDKDTKDIKTFDKDKVDKILTNIKNKKAQITDVNKAYKKNYSPQLYDLTELQRDANKLFAYSAKETLSIMQKLYEGHKLLTYPRTDSRYISSDIVETLRDRVKACGVGMYSKYAMKVLKGQIKTSKHFVDDNRVSDHHAIIPTEQPASVILLSEKERKIYDLVVKRFLACLYPPFEYEQTTITAKIGEESFIARGKIVKSLGWKQVYDNSFSEDESEDELREQTLPDINKGDEMEITNALQTKGETRPPALFNEASLLSAMENPKKYMDSSDKSLIKTMDESGGLGTVATRADIIEKLFNSFLLEKKGKDIHITSKGRQLLELVPEDLKSPTLTATWEQKLSSIAKGELRQDVFVNEMKEYAKNVVKDIANSGEKFKHDNLTRNKCPECGKYMLEVNGKKGKMLVCEDRDCNHRKSVAVVTNSRCPNCHKKLELRGQGDSQVFVCSCGHREKLSAFNARKKSEKSNVSKKEVSKYLKSQNKNEEPEINPALAAALSKFKF